MARVVAERKSSSGKDIRLVNDGNYLVDIFTIEEKREYPDGCFVWVNICRPDEMWTSKEVAMKEFLKV